MSGRKQEFRETIDGTGPHNCKKEIRRVNVFRFSYSLRRSCQQNHVLDYEVKTSSSSLLGKMLQGDPTENNFRPHFITMIGSSGGPVPLGEKRVTYKGMQVGRRE